MISLRNFRMMSFFNNPILVKPEVADNVNVEYDLQTKSSNNILQIVFIFFDSPLKFFNV